MYASTCGVTWFSISLVTENEVYVRSFVFIYLHTQYLEYLLGSWRVRGHLYIVLYSRKKITICKSSTLSWTRRRSSVFFFFSSFSFSVICSNEKTRRRWVSTFLFECTRWEIELPRILLHRSIDTNIFTHINTIYNCNGDLACLKISKCPRRG